MKVVITDYEYPNVDSERRIVEGFGATLRDCQCKSEAELIEETRDADAVIVQYCRITRQVIEKMEHCRLIIKYGIGVDNIDLKAAREHGIDVANVPAYGVEEVANHAMAFLLSTARAIPFLTAQLKEGIWGAGSLGKLQRLSTCCLGLWGFGRIPKAVCKRALSFGMRVIAYDPYLTPEQIRAEGAEAVGREELIAESDYLSLHCHLNAETRHMVNIDVFKKMKNTAYLINIARGGIVCQEDLIRALQDGLIAGAALDVFETEPLPADSPLLSMPNVIATSHMAWYSEQALADVQRMAAEEVVHVLAGNPTRTLMN